jgi:exopolysaccharide/PEP-CTERM locus tyrosine autokinase
MNDMTPRRFKGSLLERAASLYDLTPRNPALPAAAIEPAVVEPQGEGPTAHPVLPDAAVPSPVAAGPASPRTQTATIDRALLADAGMIVPGAHVTTLAEEFRLVKRHLLQTSRAVADVQPEKARTILVCSANPNDGKTFCAINLALSLAAERDVEVLLVDADFAKPDVLSRLGLSEGVGLLDALADPSVCVEDYVVPTDIPQLALLSAGTKTIGDTELLASGRARRVIDQLVSANPRRIVIFDSPPALAASPASELAAHVGQVMVVVRADRTSEADLRTAVELLNGCEHVQFVLNAVAFQPGGRRFGSYYDQGPPK